MVFSAFFSGMEIAFITSNRVRVGLDVQKKGLTSSLINIFYSHQDMFISTMLVGNNIMLVVYGMGMAVLLQPVLELVSDNSAFVLTMQTLISTCIILVTGEFLPKTVFRINPNGTMRYFALPVFLIYLLLYPISLLSSAISKLIIRMMRKMLAEKKSIAVIVDEFGGTGGLVTLEDLVEEILGDFEDEHDRRTIVSEKIDDNTFEFSGRIEVETMNELYDLDLPENDEYQTLAGYILYNLEKLPQQGESFELDGYRFTVLKQSATKIELVRVERLEKNDEE